MEDKNQKPITIENLAVLMQAGFAKAKEDNESLVVLMQAGFAKAKEDNESLAIITAQGFDNTATKQDITDLKLEISEVKHEISAVKSNVNNYLELSEKRYVELKHRDAVLAKWIKLVAEKTGVPIDVSQLEGV